VQMARIGGVALGIGVSALPPTAVRISWRDRGFKSRSEGRR
jgi:hypothetical protein